jgi:Mrp family chromosome partitioning ATPase
MKDNMDATVEAQQFGQLRARIEATFREPTMIVVTSAVRGDGKSATAFGLAASLAAADHRVLLVDANVDAPTLTRTQHRPILASRIEVAQVSAYATPVAGQLFRGVSFADERLESAASMEKITAAAADIRAHFDFTIIDTAQLIRSNLAVLFATVADGTLLTLRLGRLSTGADEETVKTLTRVGANVLGALTVAPKTINGFRARLAAADQAFLLPARHVTTRHSAGPEVARSITEAATRPKVVS